MLNMDGNEKLNNQGLSKEADRFDRDENRPLISSNLQGDNLNEPAAPASPSLIPGFAFV